MMHLHVEADSKRIGQFYRVLRTWWSVKGVFTGLKYLDINNLVQSVIGCMPHWEGHVLGWVRQLSATETNP